MRRLAVAEPLERLLRSDALQVALGGVEGLVAERELDVADVLTHNVRVGTKVLPSGERRAQKERCFVAKATA